MSVNVCVFSIHLQSLMEEMEVESSKIICRQPTCIPARTSQQ